MKQPFQKILHVDDDHVIRLITKTALDRHERNFEVISCASASEALSCIDNFIPDLLLVDYHMPIMDGASLVQAIRKSSAYYSMIPVIFITGKEVFHFENHDSLSPVLGVIKKPFSPAQLVADIDQLWAADH